MSYKHLTIEERYQIQAYKEAGFSKSAIGDECLSELFKYERVCSKNVE